jgi:cation diffusion facilitator family transporter
MAAGTSKTAVYAALFGNLAIAVTKFSAALYTGSSAMLSEAIHSLVDTGNQGLLLYGMRQATRPPSSEHPFGYGMELYFWSFVVAILIFGLGAGLSIWEGVNGILDPHPVTDPEVTYVVLGLAILFEAGASFVAARAFWAQKGSQSFLRAVRNAKDPSLFTVLFEDTAAIIGLLIALVGIYAGHVLEIPWLDGAAAVAIGIVLATVALFLAYECKSLLVGEAAARSTVDGIRNVIAAEPRVMRVDDVLTMHLGPQEVLVAADIDFIDSLDATGIEGLIADLELRIRERYPNATRIYLEARHLPAETG